MFGWAGEWEWRLVFERVRACLAAHRYALFWFGKALHFGLFLLLPLYLHRSIDAVLCYVLFVCTPARTPNPSPPIVSVYSEFSLQIQSPR